jgi:hypothetical protein
MDLGLIPPRMSSSPAQRLITRALIVACGLLLIATATLLARVVAQRADLDAQAIRATLAEQECRGLRQQLEAERLLATAQTRLLREALATAAPGQSPLAPVAAPSRAHP